MAQKSVIDPQSIRSTDLARPQCRRLLAVIPALLLALAALALHSQPLSAQTGGGNAEPLRVTIKPLAPFVIMDGESQRGFSIDLWQEIATRMGTVFEYQRVETVKDQLDSVAQDRADIAITGISITKERERVVDFSMPYFTSGLQILTAVGGGRSWTTPAQLINALLTSREFIRIVVVLGLAILLVGHVFWLLERRRNPDFPKTYFRGVWEGIWYTVVTLVTVGYGDRTARSVPGRLVAMGWMFLSLLLVSGFTATITSQLTVRQIEGAIRGESDLPGKRIATVTNSTAARYLDARRLPYVGVDAINEAYALLERNEVDTVVYDAPVLLYYANGEGQGKVQVVGEVFEPQDYGIALPANSPLRERVNQALLEIIEDGTYRRIYKRWFDPGAPA